MKRWSDDLLLIGMFGLVALAVFGGPCEARACHRCRAGYRVYHAPVVHKQFVERIVEKQIFVPQQTIVFNNAYPAAAPGGTSYQAFASSYAPSANGLIALASEQAKASSAVAALASQQAGAEASLAALAIERDKIVAISEHLRAGLQSSGGGGSQTLVLQIGADGSVRQVQPQQVQPPQESGVGRPPQGSVIAERCGKCHSGSQPKAGFYLDGSSSIAGATAWSAVKAINSGKMPPSDEPELTGEEKQSILDELQKLESKG